MKPLSPILISGLILLSSVASSAEIGNAPPPPRILFSSDGRPHQELERRLQRQSQVEYGTVCRNGAYHCDDAGKGIVGYSCGCGFCGWWSKD
jgi:hypothetical protein